MERTTQTESVLKEWNEVKTFKVDITLDPLTAHSQLEVYSRKKMVSSKNEGDYDSKYPYVLSENKFSPGQTYWEVVVQSSWKHTWYVGVATTDAVKHKAVVPLNAGNGFWILSYKKGNGYCVSADPPTPLSGIKNLETLGVFLDCDRQKLSFYDADSEVHLYSFADVSSNSNTFFAVFSPGLDRRPLTIK
ncbi:hypothetical protein J4Q44_G00043230 [Coregonus suidteri]|uniref:B30.2/SPRY domain-containing protein n=1 Tax=Coregonus suidteri TaxID=861788 RepID=A0AAN8R4K3_9TELE